MSANDSSNSNRSILVTIVSLIFIASAFVFGVIVSGKVDGNSTPLISTVLGFISLGIVSLVALLAQSKTQDKIAKTHDTVDSVEAKVDRVLNGDMEAKMRKIVEDVLVRQLENDRIDRERGQGNGSVTKPRYFVEPLDVDDN